MPSQPTAVEPLTSSTFDGSLPTTGPKPLPAEHIGTPSTAHPQQQQQPQQLSTQQSQGAVSPIHTPSRTRNNSVGQSPIVPVASPGHKHSSSTLEARLQALEQLQENPESSLFAQKPEFLTSLASQERRVLEIREELEKAEQDLRELKEQWMSQESTKKINEDAKIHQMRPLSGPSANQSSGIDDADGSSAWMYEEMERRKALINRGKRSSRRVFSGSRNPRPLSLVPEGASNHFSTPNLMGLLSSDERAARCRTSSEMLPPPERGRRSPTSFIRSPSTSPTRRSSYFAAGNHLATELRKGLWTFFEDLKNAAVGDDPGITTSSSLYGHRKRNNPLASDRPKRATVQTPLFDWASSPPRHHHNNHFRDARPSPPQNNRSGASYQEVRQNNFVRDSRPTQKPDKRSNDYRLTAPPRNLPSHPDPISPSKKTSQKLTSTPLKSTQPQNRQLIAPIITHSVDAQPAPPPRNAAKKIAQPAKLPKPHSPVFQPTRSESSQSLKSKPNTTLNDSQVKRPLAASENPPSIEGQSTILQNSYSPDSQLDVSQRNRARASSPALHRYNPVRDSDILTGTRIVSMNESEMPDVLAFPKPPALKPAATPATPTTVVTLHNRVIDSKADQTWNASETKQPAAADSDTLSNSGNTSPSPQASPATSSASDSTGATPRQSSEPLEQRSSIPWPAMDKSGPGPLLHTATNLVEEWEKGFLEDAALAAHWTFEYSNENSFE